MASNKKSGKKSKTKKKTVKKEKDRKKKFNNPLLCEIYNVYDKGKKKIKKVCSKAPEYHANKKELKREEKILKITLLIIGIIFIGFIASFYIADSSKEFEFQGVTYNKVVDEGGIVFYHTQYPIMHEGNKVNYHVWIRKDPRKTYEKIPFEGDFALTDLTIVNLTGDFSCDGYGTVAMGNVNQVLTSIGSKMGYAHLIKDENLTAECDSQGRYTYIKIKSGDESKIVQTGPSCYDFVVKDCQMLDVTERFLLEIFERVPKEL